MKYCLIVFFVLLVSCQNQQQVTKTATVPKDALKVHGFGIVKNLNDTGDSNRSLLRKVRSLLYSRNVSSSNSSFLNDLKAHNVAVVYITGYVEKNSSSGSSFNCNVSTVGDSSSLAGGDLMITPLYDPTGRLIGFANGFVSEDTGTPTTGVIKNGLTVAYDAFN